MSNSSKKVVVFTATGAQGSSVCKFLVREGYHVVGITRNTQSEGAKGVCCPVLSPESRSLTRPQRSPSWA
jgi:GDP-D-mannose dehydratase